MKNILAILFVFLGHGSINAQSRLYSNDAKISFYSKTAMENIEAENKRALCIWDTATGKLEFSVLIKGFEFDRALMQEHFNENYMESDKFPKAFFKGTLKSEKPMKLQLDNNYTAKADGMLTIHGVTKQVSVPVTISSKNGKISSAAVFSVLLSDYNISIPSIVAYKINKSIRIAVSVAAYKKL